MKFENLRRGELIAIVGGAILAVAVFLAWYKTGNANSQIYGHTGGGKHWSPWQVLSILRVMLLLAAIAPLILAYIIAREHALSWPRGELTAVVGITALTLILVRGLILKPGTPAGQISLDYGWFVALVGSILILYGAITRAGETEKARKPPGVI